MGQPLTRIISTTTDDRHEEKTNIVLTSKRGGKVVQIMAFYDWNNDGKKDFSDDFIEYQIYKQSTSNNNYTHNF